GWGHVETGFGSDQRIPLDDREGIRTRFGAEHTVAGFAQELAHGSRHRRLVVNHQDCRLVAAHLGRSICATPLSSLARCAWIIGSSTENLAPEASASNVNSPR